MGKRAKRAGKNLLHAVQGPTQESSQRPERIPSADCQAHRAGLGAVQAEVDVGGMVVSERAARFDDVVKDPVWQLRVVSAQSQIHDSARSGQKQIIVRIPDLFHFSVLETQPPGHVSSGPREVGNDSAGLVKTHGKSLQSRPTAEHARSESTGRSAR